MIIIIDTGNEVFEAHELRHSKETLFIFGSQDTARCSEPDPNKEKYYEILHAIALGAEVYSLVHGALGFEEVEVGP